MTSVEKTRPQPAEPLPAILRGRSQLLPSLPQLLPWPHPKEAVENWFGRQPLWLERKEQMRRASAPLRCLAGSRSQSPFVNTEQGAAGSQDRFRPAAHA